MIPSSGYFFSLFSRQFSIIQLLFDWHETDNKVHVSAKVCRRAFSQSADEDVVREVATGLSEEYAELRERCAALQRTALALACRSEPPPCAHERRLLAHCYTLHEQQPLKCHHLVTEFMQCVRDHALAARP